MSLACICRTFTFNLPFTILNRWCLLNFFLCSVYRIKSQCYRYLHSPLYESIKLNYWFSCQLTLTYKSMLTKPVLKHWWVTQNNNIDPSFNISIFLYDGSEKKVSSSLAQIIGSTKLIFFFKILWSIEEVLPINAWWWTHVDTFLN